MEQTRKFHLSPSPANNGTHQEREREEGDSHGGPNVLPHETVGERKKKRKEEKKKREKDDDLLLVLKRNTYS